MQASEAVDKIAGCLFGGAIGDAWGGVYENQPVPPPSWLDRHWRLSDDTQLTLATCEAMVTSDGKVDPARIAEVFAAWHRAKRITGLGASTYKALTELVAGGHWALVGAKGERAAGNGAAMRIAPLAFVLDLADMRARRTLRDVARITHHHEEAYVGALAVAAAIRFAFDGRWKGASNLLQLVLAVLPDTLVRDRLVSISEEKIADESVLAARFGSSGFVAESVPLALFAAQRVGQIGFQPMLEALLACGGDTDSNCSIAGQVAGTWLGRRGIPAELLEWIPERKFIESSADQFATAMANKLD